MTMKSTAFLSHILEPCDMKRAQRLNKCLWIATFALGIELFFAGSSNCTGIEPAFTTSGTHLAEPCGIHARRVDDWERLLDALESGFSGSLRKCCFGIQKTAAWDCEPDTDRFPPVRHCLVYSASRFSENEVVFFRSKSSGTIDSSWLELKPETFQTYCYVCLSNNDYCVTLRSRSGDNVKFDHLNNLQTGSLLAMQDFHTKPLSIFFEQPTDELHYRPLLTVRSQLGIDSFRELWRRTEASGGACSVLSEGERIIFRGECPTQEDELTEFEFVFDPVKAICTSQRFRVHGQPGWCTFSRTEGDPEFPEVPVVLRYRNDWETLQYLQESQGEAPHRDRFVYDVCFLVLSEGEPQLPRDACRLPFYGISEPPLPAKPSKWLFLHLTFWGVAGLVTLALIRKLRR